MHFISPFRATIVGPSMAGKTEFVKKLIINKDQVIGGLPLNNILWCCKKKEYAPLEFIKSVKKFTVYEGVPDTDLVKPNTLVILDDLMLESDSKEVVQLFTVNSHHKAISVLMLTQNFFNKGRLTRDISLSNSYIVFFKNVRCRNQFSFLARQIMPHNWKALEKVYIDATSKPFSYLLIDLTQQANEILRFKSDIFEPHFFYCYTTTDDVKKYNEEIQQVAEEQVFLVSSFTG